MNNESGNFKGNIQPFKGRGIASRMIFSPHEQKPFKPSWLEKKLIAKFGKPLVYKAFRQMVLRNVIGTRYDDPIYSDEGYNAKKNFYFIYWDKLKAEMHANYV